MATPAIEVQAGDRVVRVTNPEKVYFPRAGYTKRDVVEYYVAVGEAALRGVRRRPVILKRFVDGVEGDPFFQKRAPAKRPEWIGTARVTYPSGRSADLVVADEVADLAWMANLGCVDLNPWPVRTGDVDHPDELRVDLDPTPEASFDDVRRVAMLVGEVLGEFGYTSFPKTSGSRGIHIYVRIEPRWDFGQVRRSALAIAREVERRAPTLATSAWWKEERRGVFIDYNQNARDRTMASAYSVRATPDARVSCPLDWSEVPDADPAAFTLRTVPARLAEQGDAHAGIDDVAFSLQPLLGLVERHEAEGLGDAPWPPHFRKQPGEPTRAQPSRRKRPKD
ncbi:MAG: DNA polymerase domain-containing protein [Dehalococcoidia bacterium]